MQAPDYEVTRLVRAVREADAELRRQPARMRELADRRTRALRELIAALGGNAREAARRLGWPPTTVYRVRDGRFARTSARRAG